jgi:hypothetical protein
VEGSLKKDASDLQTQAINNLCILSGKKETEKQLKISELYVDSQDESRITCKIIKLSLQIHLFTTK